VKNNIKLIFQTAMVFVGTIVGAGLASGQEIVYFFTRFGKWSFLSLLLPLLLYVFIGRMVIILAVKYNLRSYDELMTKVSPGILGKITGIFTTLHLLSSSSIIVAGSGALIHQYFHVSKYIGTVIMVFIAIIALLRNTKGLVEINSFIVPSLTLVIITIFILYIRFSSNLTVNFSNFPQFREQNFWLVSAILYGGFNIMGCSGVLTPLSNETKKTKPLIVGLFLGAFLLTLLSLIINLMLTLNVPNIFKYEIPLLYVAHRFGSIFQVTLLIIIFAEMFSTIVSDVFSISRTLGTSFKLGYKKALFLVMLIIIPISRLGFGNLIATLYPIFGVVSLIFLFQITKFYYKDKRHFSK